MGNKKIKVIHIDTEKSWRGGQQQAAYLFEHMVRNFNNTILVCPKGSKFEEFCKTKDLPFASMKMKGELDFISGLKIARLAKKEKYHILHAHSSHALAIALWAKLFYNRLKIIGVRRVDFHIRKNLFSRFKYTSKLVDKIVCISEQIRRVLIDDKVPEEKLVTIRSGVNIIKFADQKPLADLNERYNIPKRNIVIGTIAALVGHKDYPNLLKAARLVLDQSDDVTFIALGDGKDSDSIKQLHSKLQLGNSFIFAGFQQDVGSYLKAFDIYVMASKLEGLGTSILDAISVGLPIAATNAGGIPEIIQNEVNGLLVPARDPQALSEAILRLCREPELRSKLSKNGLNSVKQFDIGHTIEQNLKLYETLIK